MFTPLTQSERGKLLTTWREALARYNEAMQRSSLSPPFSPKEAAARAEAEPHLRVAEQAERDYFERLPDVNLGCCPFDGKPLVRSFDPFGFDGPWWRPDRTPDEATPCRHFLVLAGAVSYGERKPWAGDTEVYPGPEVPYVIPRILQQPTVIAVIASLLMENGYIAYPIAYFAEQRLPPQDLTASWPRTNYVYIDQLGQDGWRIPHDPWDFNLTRWLTAGKIRWCVPGTDNSQLSADPPGKCPYANLAGRRERMIVIGDRVAAGGLPEGETLWPLAVP